MPSMTKATNDLRFGSPTIAATRPIAASIRAAQAKNTRVGLPHFHKPQPTYNKIASEATADTTLHHELGLSKLDNIIINFSKLSVTYLTVKPRFPILALIYAEC